jgi:hypothetical protein
MAITDAKHTAITTSLLTLERFNEITESEKKEEHCMKNNNLTFMVFMFNSATRSGDEDPDRTVGRRLHGIRTCMHTYREWLGW